MFEHLNIMKMLDLDIINILYLNSSDVDINIFLIQ